MIWKEPFAQTLQGLLHQRKQATDSTLSCKISAVGHDFTVAARILWV